MRDKVERGRSARGSRNAASKLNERDVVAILKLCAKNEPRKNVAKWFTVSTSTVDLIVARKTWKHVSEALGL